MAVKHKGEPADHPSTQIFQNPLVQECSLNQGVRKLFCIKRDAGQGRDVEEGGI